MNVGEEEVWQIAAGDTVRSYADLCLQWGVVLFGPGYQGPWPDCEAPLRDDGETQNKIGLIRKYHEDINGGDIVVLRLGTSEVYGVGRVEGPVKWYDDFGDIDGWDIQLVRRVKWCWKAANGEPKRFGTWTLKWGDTIQRLDRTGPVFEWLLQLPEGDTELPALPSSCRPNEPIPQIDIGELAEYLFDQGTAAGAINALAESMRGLQQIASWYRRRGTHPSESETVAYLVVPLLRTLGWTPQRMAVEWDKIDIALFDRLQLTDFDCFQRTDENLAAVVEVKRLGHSCLSSKNQGTQYACSSRREKCSRLVLTDGIRYAIYVKKTNGTFSESPTAYMNLNRMVRSYPVLKCEGAPKALSLLAADWRSE